MAELVKVLSTKPEDLSFNLRTTKQKKRTDSHQLSAILYMNAMAEIHMYVYT